MFPSPAKHNLTHWVVIFSALLVISACGGGKKRAPDTTPTAFSFTVATNQARDTSVTSNTITIAGLGEGVAADLTVSGGQYAIGEGAFTNTATTITNGQTVALRGQSSPNFATTTTVNLTVGSVNGSFNITTLARDDAPVAFAPAAQTDVALSAVVTFPAVTVSGINDAVAISITGSSSAYAINGGEFTSAAGTVNEGDEVQVRLTASDAFSTSATASLTIGSVSGDFTATTLALDDAPNGFTPANAQTGIVVSQDFTFPAFTVSGINDTVDISIAGTNVAYAINSGEFTSEAATVSAGDEVQVRVRAPATFATTNTANLTIGSVTGPFSVVSEVEDTTPNTFSFADATTNEASTWVESLPVTISGINSAAPVSITNGEYRIGAEGVYTSAAGTVTNGQQVQVRVLSSAQAGQSTTATLSVGGVLASFIATTEDTTAPQASVVFPTPNTLSDGTTLTLRGKVVDDFGPVASITVVVTTDGGATTVDTQTLIATGNDNFQTTWSQQVALAQDKVNTISVTASDAAGNAQEAATVVTVTQSTTEINFPVEENVYFGAISTQFIDLDRANNRLLVPVFDGGARILSVDLSTGNREVFIASNPAFVSLNGVLVLAQSSQLLFADVSEGVIYSADLSTGNYNVLSDTNTQGSDVAPGYPAGLRMHSDGRLFVSASTGLYSIDMASGVRTSVSGAGGVNPFSGPQGLVLDEEANRALVANGNTSQLLAVDLGSGERTILLDSDVLTSPPIELELDRDKNRIYFVSLEGSELFALDFATNEVSVVSGNTAPNSANGLSLTSGIALNEENEIAFVTSTRAFDVISSIKLVDLTTGERVSLTYSKP